MKLFKIIGLVALINIVARLLGFAREMVIGFQYGTSPTADHIITAFTIPNFLYIVVGGAVTTAFISVYSKLKESEKQTFMNTVFTYLMIVMTGITIVLMIFAEPIIDYVFTGLEGESLRQTTDLFLWMAPASLFLVFAMWFSGVLNVHERYSRSALSTLVFNLLFLLLAVALTPWLGPISYGVGALLGSIAMVLVVIKKGLTLHISVSPEFKRMLKLAGPILLGGATLQFYFLIHRIFATQLPDGYVAALNYASKLTQFPQAVLMTAVTTVIYPTLAKKVAAHQRADIEQLYNKGFRLLYFLLMPATVFVYVYSEDLIELIFQYGNFTEQSTQMTYPLLQIFALSMFVLAMNVYITRFFYAMERSILPVAISIVSVFGINILVILVFIDSHGAAAIAWGTTISAIIQFILLALTAKKMLGLNIVQHSDELFRLVLMIGVLGACLFFVSKIFTVGIAIVNIMIGLFLLFLLTVIFMKILNVQELHLLMKKFKR